MAANAVETAATVAVGKGSGFAIVKVMVWEAPTFPKVSLA